MKKDLVNFDKLKISQPLKVKKKFFSGDYIRVSLSHEGILAIAAHDKKYKIQFTNLATDKQADIEVENGSHAAFYDHKVLLLTYGMNLRESIIETIFDKPNISSFERIPGTNEVDPDTDVSLLNDTRTLYYNTTNEKLFTFNVDTRKIIGINIRKKINTMASLTGINCGMRAIFCDYKDKHTYALNIKTSAVEQNKEQYDVLTTVFPSRSCPENINKAVFKYNNYIMNRGKKVSTNSLIVFNTYYSVVRLYGDVFLAYDDRKNSWVLVRIVVP